MSKERIVKAVQKIPVKSLEGLSATAISAIADAMFDAIGDELAKKGTVRFPGFGTFKVIEWKARPGRNLQTGDPIEIPASKLVSFKAATRLKSKL